MTTTVGAGDVEAFALGARLLGAGGGGSPRLIELMLSRSHGWPVHVDDVESLDPDTPCIAGAFIGSTLIHDERLPSPDPFGSLAQAIERWIGAEIPAVCSFEGGGVNSMVPLLFAPGRTILDADLSGRAVPFLDQFSLFVDRVPGLVIACESGAGGITLVQSDRGADTEEIVRSAIIQAGGIGPAVVGGFTVGDLLNHAVLGHLSRTLELGRIFENRADASMSDLASALGGNILFSGRIVDVVQDAHDPHVHTVELITTDERVCRIVCRSEILACVVDGATVAASPTVIFAIDSLTRRNLEVTELVLNRHIAVFSLPASPWWNSDHRRAAIAPSVYGIQGLDEVHEGVYP